MIDDEADNGTRVEANKKADGTQAPGIIWVGKRPTKHVHRIFFSACIFFCSNEHFKKNLLVVTFPKKREKDTTEIHSS